MKSLFLAAFAIAGAAAQQGESAVAGDVDSNTLRRRVADLWKDGQAPGANSLPRSAGEGSFVLPPVEEEDDEDMVIPVDPIRRALALNATSPAEARKLGGIFGLCADGLVIPPEGALVCDPPNALPQICSMQCRQGYYSSGAVDVACADAMCQGNCKAEAYECKGNALAYGSRECSYTRYTSCDTVESGMCLETVTEPCSYSYYVETTRPCCNFTQIDSPDGCWNSGCSGTCGSPGVFHYYSQKCGDSCPPWRDPVQPSFACKPCRPPTTFSNVGAGVVKSNAVGTDPASLVTVGCLPGYFGAAMDAFCMVSDGSFYPDTSSVSCSVCSAPPAVNSGLVEAVVTASTDGIAGTVSYQCIPGFVGTPFIAKCDSVTGAWTNVVEPDCQVAPTPSVTATASVSPTPSFDPELYTAVPTITPTASITATGTPSVSKSPRPPKVKGSRAPSPAAKAV